MTRPNGEKPRAATQDLSIVGFQVQPLSDGNLCETIGEFDDSLMATTTISHARDHLPDAMETARTEAVFVRRHGRSAGVGDGRRGIEHPAETGQS